MADILEGNGSCSAAPTAITVLQALYPEPLVDFVRTGHIPSCTAGALFPHRSMPAAPYARISASPSPQNRFTLSAVGMSRPNADEPRETAVQRLHLSLRAGAPTLALVFSMVVAGAAAVRQNVGLTQAPRSTRCLYRRCGANWRPAPSA
jgi:hypothetical protein